MLHFQHSMSINCKFFIFYKEIAKCKDREFGPLVSPRRFILKSLQKCNSLTHFVYRYVFYDVAIGHNTVNNG